MGHRHIGQARLFAKISVVMVAVAVAMAAAVEVHKNKGTWQWEAAGDRLWGQEVFGFVFLDSPWAVFFFNALTNQQTNLWMVSKAAGNL